MRYPQRSAGVCAELILRETSRFIGESVSQFVGLVEWVVGVQNFVAQILIGFSVETIGARLRAEVQYAAGKFAPVRTRVAGLYLELLDRILGWNDDRQIDVADIQRLPIEIIP